MRVLIIEDEKIAADNLEKILISIDSDIQVIDKIESVRNAVKWLSKNFCDLIFLDVQLSDGISFKIFEHLEIKTPVIFTTAFDQYAIKAFKLNSIDYLLKPIEVDQLRLSLTKYKNMQEGKNFNIKALIDTLNKKIEYQSRFMVYSGNKIHSVKVKDIAYFYLREGSVFFCTSEGKQYDLDYTLDKLHQILNPDFYFRINRQFIVNIESIDQMHLMSKSRLKLDLKPKCDIEAIVSFNKSHDFKKWLNK